MDKCYDCGRRYGDEHGFPDLIIETHAWNAISPTGDGGGLLCPSCICKRLHEQGIKTTGAFMSGPVDTVSPALMTVMCDISNLKSRVETECSDEAHMRRLYDLLAKESEHHARLYDPAALRARKEQP